jgi:hypothetical protein
MDAFAGVDQPFGLATLLEGEYPGASLLFATATTYTACESLAVVEQGAAATIQLTIHGDHLFHDDLFAAEPNVTFETLAAADADADGEVTPAELAAFDIRALPNCHGPSRVPRGDALPPLPTPRPQPLRRARRPRAASAATDT